jgi:hypothetical protein
LLILRVCIAKQRCWPVSLNPEFFLALKAGRGELAAAKPDILAHADNRAACVFQHACFVYTAQFHPTATAPRVVATGASDHLARPRLCIPSDPFETTPVERFLKERLENPC